MIDSHCHIHYIKEDTRELLQKIFSSGVKRILNVAVTESEWEQNLVLGEHSSVDIGLGVHPCDIKEAQTGWQERLIGCAKHPAVVAVGETGLDYYRDTSFKVLQQQAFEDHIYIAKQLNKPIIVHMRSATEDTISILQKHKNNVRGVIHCFSEDWPAAKALIDCGMMISFSGIVTFKNAKAIQEAALHVPLDRLLVETDAPYLAPVPHRGKTNYPYYVMYVIEYISKMRGISVESLIEATTKNYESWVSA